VKLVEQEANEAEKASLEVLQQNLDQIFNVIYQHKREVYTADSINVYKKRMRRILSDYSEYGFDSEKLAGWNRPVRSLKPRRSLDTAKEEFSATRDTHSVGIGGVNFTKFEIPLELGGKAVVTLTSEMTARDKKKIIAHLNAETTGGGSFEEKTRDGGS